VLWTFNLTRIMSRLALVLLFVYAVLLAPVLTDFRSVMGDEAAYADPALRWAQGLGLTSGAWWQRPDQLWACNFPLHALTTALWIKLTGWSSLWGLRAFSLLLYLAGIALWIIGCRRAGWFKSSTQEIGFVALLFGSLYATAPSQYIRPEALGAVVLGFAVWSQTLSVPWTRCLSAFIAGLLAAVSGLQFAVALIVFAFVWFFSTDSRPRWALIWFVIGGLVGLAVVLATSSHFGVLDIFLRSTFGLGSNRAEQWHGWRDPMLWACSAVLLYVAIGRAFSSSQRRWAASGLAAGPGLALALYSLSKYPQYYGFLAVLPACTAVASVFPSLLGFSRTIALLLLVGASAVGFPLSALMNWNLMPARQHSEVERWAQQILGDADVVFADPSAYFAARRAGRVVYTQAVLRALSPAELGNVQKVIVMPDHPHGNLRKETVLERLGGDWVLVGDFPDRETFPRIPALGFLGKLSYAGSYRFEALAKVSLPQFEATSLNVIEK
jgi:hypothetical protein